MRQIIFDTETTGMNKGASYKGGHTVASGHRIIEIGCIELIDRRPTGNHYHTYIQPDREVDPEAVGVHGITDEFLIDKPRFADIADELWAYLDGADELIAHNMRFDQCFFDEELRLLGEQNMLADRFALVDTLEIAKKLVECCKQGKDDDAKALYASDAVSVEAGAPPGQSREAVGLAAIKAKGSWWVENHEVHSMNITRPLAARRALYRRLSVRGNAQVDRQTHQDGRDGLVYGERRQNRARGIFLHHRIVLATLTI